VKIEIGKQYIIRNAYKKTVVEFSTFYKDDIEMNRELTWRSGEFLVTVNNEIEADYIKNSLTSEDPYARFNFSVFDEYELLETFDGVADELWSDDDEELAEQLSDQYWDSEELQDEYFDIVDWLESTGWEWDDNTIYIAGQIDAEEYIEGN